MRREIRHLFLFIGADPNTAWLADSEIKLDEKGFVRTGFDECSYQQRVKKTLGFTAAHLAK